MTTIETKRPIYQLSHMDDSSSSAMSSSSSSSTAAGVSSPKYEPSGMFPSGMSGSMSGSMFSASGMSGGMAGMAGMASMPTASMPRAHGDPGYPSHLFREPGYEAPAFLPASTDPDITTKKQIVVQILKALHNSSLASELQFYRNAVQEHFGLEDDLMDELFAFDKMAEMFSHSCYDDVKFFAGKPLKSKKEKKGSEKTKVIEKEKTKEKKEVKKPAKKPVREPVEMEEEDEEDSEDLDSEDDEDDDEESEEDDSEEDDDEEDDEDAKEMEKIIQKAGGLLKKKGKETKEETKKNKDKPACKTSDKPDKSKTDKDKSTDKPVEKNNHEIARFIRQACRKKQQEPDHVEGTYDYTNWVFETVSDTKLRVIVPDPEDIAELAEFGPSEVDASANTVTFKKKKAVDE